MLDLLLIFASLTLALAAYQWIGKFRHWSASLLGDMDIGAAAAQKHREKASRVKAAHKRFWLAQTKLKHACHTAEGVMEAEIELSEAKQALTRAMQDKE